MAEYSRGEEIIDNERGSERAERNGALVERLAALAAADGLDPNERCACVTLALALLVCPREVEVEASDFMACDDLRYRNVRMSLPTDAGTALRQPFFFAWMAARPRLPNLRETYEDYENNLEARELAGYWPLCETHEAKAALLTLAWICLVEGYREVHKAFNGSYTLSNARYGVELKLDTFKPNRVVRVSYAPPPRRPRPPRGALTVR